MPKGETSRPHNRKEKAASKTLRNSSDYRTSKDPVVKVINNNRSKLATRRAGKKTGLNVKWQRQRERIK